MTPGDRQVRLALTVFSEPASLWRAVTALLDGGLSIEQLCIVALASVLDRFAPNSSMSDGRDDQFVELHTRVEDWLGSTAAERIVATPGPLLPLAAQAVAKGTRGPATSALFATSPTTLAEDVRAGLVALIVRSHDPKQQLLATQALLEQGRQKVMTFEFRAPGTAETRVPGTDHG